MKLSFSTLGCPEWSWNEIIATAKDMGFDGVEIRGVGKELYAPAIKEFTSDYIDDTKKKLSDTGIEIICLASACYLYDKEKTEKFIAEGKEYIDTANRLNAKFIRVLGDKDPWASSDIDDSVVANALSVLGEYAKDKNVTVLIETNGVYADTKRLAKLLGNINTDGIGVLWDIHHPYRYFGEFPRETYANIGKYVKYVHLKDSVEGEDSKLQYKMMGRGNLPIKETVRILNTNGYDGYLSLEWVRRWYSDLEAPGVVFLQYISYMKKLI